MAASTPPEPFRVALVGAGRVGTAVAQLLTRKGHIVVGVFSRTAASAERSAALLGTGTFDAPSELPECDVVLLGVPENAIAQLAAELAPYVSPGAVVCHFAGAVGVRPLRAVTQVGAAACALHPVQSCPDAASAVNRLPGSFWGVTSSPDASDWARDVVSRDLEGVPVEVAEENRPLWHAAAVTTSNGIAAVMSIGESILGSIGIGAPERVLGPLAAGTVANAHDGGGAGVTLTGPVVRGESSTIRAHLEALATKASPVVPLYALVVEIITRAAAHSARIDRSTERAILDAIEAS